MDNNTGQPPGTIPPEKDYSAEELAFLQAAMMEELGISRVDKLPLADQGPPVGFLQPSNKPKNVTNTAIAAWHNLHLEERTDPTKADLDNIADGQLYRLRRGASSGRSRGNSGHRGGHFSPGQRGGGRGGRGGFDQGVNGYVGHGRQDNKRFDTTPKSFFRNARADLNSSTHVDRVLTRLRVAMESSSVDSPTNHHPGHGPAAPLHSNHQPRGKTHLRLSRPGTPQHINSQPVQSRVVLDNGDQFLKWAGIEGSATAKPSAKPVASATSKPGLAPSTVPANQSTPVTKTSTHVITGHSQDGPSTSSLGNQGLLGSKWGLSSEQPDQPSIVARQLSSKPQNAAVSPQSIQVEAVPAPQQPVGSRNELNPEHAFQIAAYSSVFTERQQSRRVPVKIMKSGTSTPREAVAIMAKKNETDELYSLVVTDTLTGTVLIDEFVAHDALIEVHGTLFTYRAAQHTAEKPPTWQIMFQLPIFAASFANFVFLERQATGYVPRTASGFEHGLDHSINLDTPSYSLPSAINASMTQNRQADIMNQHTSKTSDHSRSYHPAYDLQNVSASGPSGRDTQPDNVEVLISLGDDDQTYVPTSTMNSDIFDLLEADDSDTIEALFGRLGGNDEFFNLMSYAVVANGGKAVHHFAPNELMLDPLYRSALQGAIARFLSHSETFAMLPEDYCAAFVQNKSRKVMEFALSRSRVFVQSNLPPIKHNNIGDTQAEEPTVSTFVTMISDNSDHKDNTHQTLSKPVSSPVEVGDAQRPDYGQDTRIKYSPDSLLSLRSQAIPVDISDQPPRERRPTRVFAPHITSVKEWQAVHATGSKSSAPVQESRITSPSVISGEVGICPKEASQNSTHPVRTSSSTTIPAPARSTAVSWQAFAGEKELQAAAKDQSTPTAPQVAYPTKSEPIEIVESTPKAAVSTEGVFSITPSTVVSPPEGQNTNDALWASLLGTASSPKTIVHPKPKVPQGNLRHRPSKSDINDRLAKDFSGLNINTHVASSPQPATPVSAKPDATPQSEAVMQLTSVTSFSYDASLATPKVDVNIQSTPESSLDQRVPAPFKRSNPVAQTPASQAMQEKINAALKHPLVASPRLSSAGSFTRTSSVADPTDRLDSQLKTTLDVKNKDNSSLPASRLKSDAEQESGPSNGDTLSPPAIMTAESQVKSSTVNAEPLKNPNHSDPIIDHTRRDASAAQRPKPNDAFDETLNKVLKGVPGLSASKWADESATPQVTGNPIPMPQPSAYEATQKAAYYPQGSHLNQAPGPGYAPMAPVMATVIVADGAGGWKEVTGMVKTGSIPVVAHAPVPHTSNRYAENVRPQAGHPDHAGLAISPSFPVRPSTFQHHSSFSSVNSESKINPGAPTFKPSPQRAQGPTLGQRQPLSPTKNIQSQLQSRLNSSMTGPRMSYQGPQL